MAWAVNGRRKDEWSRFSELLSLVHNRTLFDKDGKATDSFDWLPSGLMTEQEIAAARAAAKAAAREAKNKNVVRVPFSVAMKRAFG